MTSVKGGSTITRPKFRPVDPYLRRLDGDTPIMKFYQYRRDYSNLVNPMTTELQAFQYISHVLAKQADRDSPVHIPPRRLVFKHNNALLSFNLYARLSYFELSESLRTMGAFHLQYGYFEKLFSLQDSGGRLLLTGRMCFSRAPISAECLDTEGLSVLTES